MTPPHPLYKILVISDYREINSSRPEAEIFVSLAQRGHQIHILSFPGAHFYNDRFRSFGIRVEESHPLKKASLYWIKYLRKLIHDEHYDFVHAFNSLGLTNAVWAMIGLPAKLIAYRGYAGQTHWYDPMMYTKYFNPRVDQIICLSNDIYHVLSRNAPWAKHKLTVIHKGHDPLWYSDIIPKKRKELGFNENDILVCCVANVRAFKGIPYLIKSTQFLTPESRINLLLIGKGYEDDTISELISKSKFSNQIHRLGYRNDSLSIVAACDASVLASTHGEALTKSVIESMCLGIPPVITIIPGNAGLVIDGMNGWLIPPADPVSLAQALTQMASNTSERLRRGQNAKEYIRKYFHTDNTVDAFIELYKKMS